MSKFSQHPSKILNELFLHRPFQGQHPAQSKVFIIGLDANWNEELEKFPKFFEEIKEYLKDGVAFWKKYGYHHPFLSPNYPLKKNTGGVPYHRKFASMGLSSDFAEFISFVELLNVPTTGISTNKDDDFFTLIDLEYVQSIIDIMFDSSIEPKLVIISPAVLKVLKKLKKYKVHIKGLDLEAVFNTTDEGIKIFPNKINNTNVILAYHFSASISLEFLHRLGFIIEEFTRTGKVI